MRDKRFVTIHRGGLLTKDNHRKLMLWASMCSGHVVSLLTVTTDKRLLHALQVAKEWENETACVGDAIKASVGAHSAAREFSNPISIAVARSFEHAVATAHMADHSLGAAWCALKAVKLAGKSMDEELEWQNKQLRQLPLEIAGLIQTTLMKKGESLKIMTNHRREMNKGQAILTI